MFPGLAAFLALLQDGNHAGDPLPGIVHFVGLQALSVLISEGPGLAQHSAWLSADTQGVPLTKWSEGQLWFYGGRDVYSSLVRSSCQVPGAVSCLCREGILLSYQHFRPSAWEAVLQAGSVLAHTQNGGNKGVGKQEIQWEPKSSIFFHLDAITWACWLEEYQSLLSPTYCSIWLLFCSLLSSLTEPSERGTLNCVLV